MQQTIFDREDQYNQIAPMILPNETLFAVFDCLVEECYRPLAPRAVIPDASSSRAPAPHRSKRKERRPPGYGRYG